MGQEVSISFDLIRPGRSQTKFFARLLHADERLIIVEHLLHPSKPFHYAGVEVIGEGYRGVWFLYNGEPFDIGRFYRPDGTWTGYYVDILEPVQWEGAEPESLKPLVDLFLDVWIAPDGHHTVLDEDEFATARESGSIGENQARAALSALQHIERCILSGEFPPLLVREYDTEARWGSKVTSTEVTCVHWPDESPPVP